MKRWLNRLVLIGGAVIFLALMAYNAKLDARNRQELSSMFPDIRRGNMIRLNKADGPLYIIFDGKAHTIMGEGIRVRMASGRHKGFYSVGELKEMGAIIITDEDLYREVVVQIFCSIYC